VLGAVVFSKSQSTSFGDEDAQAAADAGTV
jgi:hypothetical protein